MKRQGLIAMPKRQGSLDRTNNRFRIFWLLKSKLEELLLMQRVKSSKEEFDTGKREESKERRHEVATSRREYHERQLERKGRHEQTRLIERIQERSEELLARIREVLGRAENMQNYALKSGITVGFRRFRSEDARRCSEILLRNFEPLKEQLGIDVWMQEIGDVYTENNLPTVARKRDYHVAIVDGKVIGLIGFIPYSRTEVEVANLSVDQAFQGKGIGKLLAVLGVLEKIDEGISHFYAYTGKQSRGIFISLGFSDDAALPESI